MSRFARRLSATAALSLIVLLIASCADDDPERRFANDPIPTEDLVSQPTQATNSVLPTQTAPAATPIALGEMLSLIGVASHFYVAIDDAVLSIPFDGSKPAEIFDVDDSTIATVAGSPDGAMVAVVVSEASGSLSLRILDAAGREVTEAALSVPASGSPVPATGHGVARVAWSPFGDRMLITLPAGGIIELDVSGAIREILAPESAPSPLAVAWSPSGGAIAYVDAGVNGSATGLYVASTDVLPVDPVAVIRPIEGRSRQIVDIAWPAGGAGILYAERAPDGDLSVGGDLFAIPATGGTPRLVASAGRVTQIGAVDTFSIAPDGSAVAYSVATVGQGDGVVSGMLRVKQISGPTSAELPLKSGALVRALNWTSAGLTWIMTLPTSGNENGILVQRARADGSVETIYSDLPPASPVASPAASPVS